jgi:hypothetical protein
MGKQEEKIENILNMILTSNLNVGALSFIIGFILVYIDIRENNPGVSNVHVVLKKMKGPQQSGHSIDVEEMLRRFGVNPN